MSQEIKEILELLNSWWKTGEISKELAKPFKREVFNKLSGFLSYKQIIILSGLRRVGKTTILFQEIEELIKKESPEKIVYFSFDKKTENLLDILNSYQEILSVDYRKEKIFLFLDEVTKLHEWASQIKLIYDSFPNIKFFLSSSSSISLEEEALKNLAGRYFLINVQPLDFKEFLILSGKSKFAEAPVLYSKEIRKEFNRYLLRSFPETILWEDSLVIKDYLRTTIIDKIVKTDLPEKFSNLNINLLFTLLELFYKEPGMLLDYDKLSKDIKISKKTLFRHIFYLEFSYLIRKIKNFRPSTLSSTRKLQKVYPYWWNLTYCYTENLDKILENFIASYFDLNYYWRHGNKEIDFLQILNRKITPIEIKNKEKINDKELNTIVYFLNKFKIKEGMLIYNGEEKVFNFNNKKITLKDFWRL